MKISWWYFEIFQKFSKIFKYFQNFWKLKTFTFLFNLVHISQLMVMRRLRLAISRTKGWGLATLLLLKFYATLMRATCAESWIE